MLDPSPFVYLYGHDPSGLPHCPHGLGGEDFAPTRGVAITLNCRSTRFPPQCGQVTLRSSSLERTNFSNCLPHAEHAYS